MSRSQAPVAPRVTEGEATPPAPRALALGAPVALFMLAAVVVWRSLGLGYWTELGPGPGFFPFWLAVLLGGLSAAWFVQQLRAGRPAPVTPDAGQAGTRLRRGHVPAVVVSLVVLAGVMETLGYQLSMLLFLLFHLGFLGRRRWLPTVVLSVLGSFGVFTVFTWFLSVNLPTSSIPVLHGLGL